MFQYLKTFSLVVAVPVIIVVCFNLFVDPYGAWHDIRIHGFNALKPCKPLNERISKMGYWDRFFSQNILLGTSRAGHGLDPDHPGLKDLTFNMAMSMQSLEERMQLFIWSVKNNLLKNVVFESDMVTSNVWISPRVKIIDSNFNYIGRIRGL